MKEIVVISGKGGTGKTSVTASLSVLAAQRAIIADCDVDAADMHLLLAPQNSKKEDFYSGVLAKIDNEKCINCGRCMRVCRWNAIDENRKGLVVNDLDCEGCAYCARICPTGAIEMIEQNVGDWMISDIKTGSKMVHAKLKIGAENSGKLVAHVKKKAKETAEQLGKDFVLVDGSPGVGCPVVSSLSGADYVVFVTEPSVSGVHDLKRVYQLVKKFGIKSGCIINKADINSDKMDEIIEFLQQEKIDIINKINYDENFTKAMTKGKTIVEFDPENIGKVLADSWQKIQKIVEEKQK